MDTIKPVVWNFHRLRMPVWLAALLSLTMLSALADTASGKRQDERGLYSVCCAVDRPFLVFAGSRGVQVWNTQTWQRVQVIRRDKTTVVALAADGGFLAAGAGSTVTVWKWERDTFRQAWTHDVPNVAALAFAPDGKTLACGEQGAGSALLYDVGTGALKNWLFERSNGIVALAFAPDGQMLVTAGGDLKFWNPLARTPLSDAAARPGLWNNLNEAKLQGSALLGECANSAVAVAFSPDGRYAASAGSLQASDNGASKSLALWEARTRRLVRRMSAEPAEFTSAAFSADGKRVAASGSDGAIRLWQTDSGHLLTTLKAQSGLRSLTFLPGTSLLAAAGADAVQIWDIATGKIKHTLWQE